MEQVKLELPPQPVPPAQPDAYRAAVRKVNDATRSLNGALRAVARGSGIDPGPMFGDMTRAEQQLRAYLETPEGLAYGRAVREYNAAVLEYRRARAAQLQAAVNEQYRHKVRAAMCQQCWTVHRPEVECS